MSAPPPLPGAGTIQQIPKANEISKIEASKPPISECEKELAKTFGGEGAYMSATGLDYTKPGLNGTPPAYRGDYTINDGRIMKGHLSTTAAHLLGSMDGSKNTNVYIPSNGIIPKQFLGKVPKTDSKGNTYIFVHFNKLGNLTNVTLAIFHLDNIQKTRDGNRILVGRTGGPGGYFIDDMHAHFELYDGFHNSFSTAKQKMIPVQDICK
jgi:hypothetical protein